MTYAAAENIFGYWGESESQSEDEGFISHARRESVRNTVNLAVTKGLMAPAEVIYEEVGKQLLSGSTRDVLREVIEEVCKNTSEAAAKFLGKEGAASAVKALGTESAKSTTRAAGKAVLQTAAKSAAKETAKTVGKETAKAAGKETAKTAVKTAGKELIKGVGRAAAVGGVVDAAFGTWDATRGYIRGEMDGQTAVIHVVKETATGAAASAVGAVALAGAIVFTGPVGWVLGAGIVITCSTGAKLGLNTLFA